MSLAYKIVSNSVRLIGLKQMFSLPEDKFLAKVNAMNKKRGFRLPTDRKCVYGDRLIFEKYHCLTMQTGQEKAKRVILFLFGGGMMVGSDAGDVKTIRDLARRSGSDVWMPDYPLCTEHCVTETYEMVFECYRELLEEYDAENISFLGFSSGAALAIGVCLHNNALGKQLPMPRQIIASSPGAVPMSDEELHKMQALNTKDLLIDVAFMATVRTYMEHGKTVPDYMLNGTRGDFSGLPKIYFYYGGDEILSAEAEYFAAACDRVGTAYAMNVEPDMCHCYPMLPWFPEGKKAYREIATLLGEEKRNG